MIEKASCGCLVIRQSSSLPLLLSSCSSDTEDEFCCRIYDVGEDKTFTRIPADEEALYLTEIQQLIEDGYALRRVRQILNKGY